MRPKSSATVESTARYKLVHSPATRRYISSTRHDRFVMRSGLVVLYAPDKNRDSHKFRADGV